MIKPFPSRDEAPWVDMPAGHACAGYPVHRVTSYREWTNPHQCDFTDWRAACGASRTETGSSRLLGRQVFGSVLDARRLELCPTCWPDRRRR